MIYIKKVNDVYLRVNCEPSIAMELSLEFSFTVPNYKFMNAYKFGGWDGKIRLFKMMDKTLYIGLLHRLKTFLDANNYEYTVDPELFETEYSEVEAKEFISTLKSKYELKDFQLASFLTAMRSRRALFISPTGSGKSFIMYNIIRALEGRKLIIVPNLNLLKQMISDFQEYDLEGKIGKKIQYIKGGETKEISKEIVVSTWQSIVKQPKKWFDQFEAIIGDEAHLFKADSLVKIMTKAENTPYKFGLTGTLDGSLTNEMVLEGLFGKKVIVAKTKELMDSGDLATLNIKSIVLTYDDIVKKTQKGNSYEDELKFLFSHSGRNNFIKNLALSLKGNTLLIFSRVEHGKELYELVKSKSENPTYLIYGKVHEDDREQIRKIVNTHKHSITFGSMLTSSTGINIPNLHNIVFIAPSKSRVKVMQSIGRGTRVTETKTSFTLYDIADDLSWKRWKNYTLEHYLERIKMYISEKLKYKQYNVRIKE